MGHSYREIFPEEAAEHDREIDRIVALRKRLEHIPSSEFTVGELLIVMRVMNKWRDHTEQDLKRIERKLDDLMSAP